MVDSQELDLGILVNVLPRIRVASTIPDDFRTTIRLYMNKNDIIHTHTLCYLPSKTGKVPTSQGTGTTNDNKDGSNFGLVPDRPERLFGSVGGSRHFKKDKEKRKKIKKGGPVLFKDCLI